MSLPSSVFVSAVTRGPLLGSMYFHGPAAARARPLPVPIRRGRLSTRRAVPATRHAVRTISRRERLAGERRERREQIDLAHERSRDARRQAPRPPHNERHARPGFEAAVLAAAETVPPLYACPAFSTASSL